MASHGAPALMAGPLLMYVQAALTGSVIFKGGERGWSQEQGVEESWRNCRGGMELI